MKRDIVVVAHNLRSCHNVGALLRTADGLGVKKIYLTGYTPFPSFSNDSRLPHLRTKITGQIHKTALGAENTINWEHQADIYEILSKLGGDGYKIAALEQTTNSHSLPNYSPPKKIALILGEEVNGINESVLAKTDVRLEIPMFGSKESFNVIQAAAMALYHFRFAPIF